MFPVMRQRLLVTLAILLGALAWLAVKPWLMAADGSGGITFATARAGVLERGGLDRLVPRHGRFGFGPRGARGEKTGPSPMDRRKNGSKHHVLTDGQGTPLAAAVTAANRHDLTQLVPLLDAVPPVRGKPGRPRRRLEALYADRAYDSDPHRAQLRRRGIEPHLARRRAPHGSGLGVDALRRRADPGVDPSVQASPHPLRSPRRHPRVVPHPGLLRHLLASAPKRVLLGALRRRRPRTTRESTRSKVLASETSSQTVAVDFWVTIRCGGAYPPQTVSH